VDPTVCAQCAKDCGDEELPRIANLPVCEKCDDYFRNRPYPTWLKVSFAVFLALAIAAFVYNLRYFLGYVDIVRAGHAMDRGQTEQALKYYATASDRLPEIPELAVYKAQQLASEEKFDEAETILQKAQPHAAPQLRDGFRTVELDIQLASAFAHRDYDKFLAVANQLYNVRPKDPMNVASLASAYACKYATTGNKEFKDQAEIFLALAKEQSSSNPHEKDAFEDLENRIQHRLATREILSPEQFKERFPNGWKPEIGK
jgi:hypothetical protein